MPKVKTNTYSHPRPYISESGSSVFLIDQSLLFCKLCGVKVSAEKVLPFYNWNVCVF